MPLPSLGGTHIELDDEVTPEDNAVVAGVLSGLGQLSDPHRVLGALSACGVILPDGQSALLLLCRSVGISSGIDGVWPMTANDFLRVYAAVRRKGEVTIDNLCDTPEASRYLISTAGERGIDANFLRPCTPSSSMIARATPVKLGRTGSVIGFGAQRMSVTPQLGGTGSRATRSPSLGSLRRNSFGSMRGSVSQRPLPPRHQAGAGGPLDRSMRKTTFVLDTTHDDAAEVNGAGKDEASPGALRRARSVREVLQSRLDADRAELVQAMHSAILEQRARERGARRLADSDDSDHTPDARSATSAMTTPGIDAFERSCGPAAILAAQQMTPGSAPQATVREIRGVCDRFGIDTAVFDAFVAEKTKLDKLMSFARPSAKARKPNELASPKGITSPGIGFSSVPLADSESDLETEGAAPAMATEASAITSPISAAAPLAPMGTFGRPELSITTTSQQTEGSPRASPSSAALGSHRRSKARMLLTGERVESTMLNLFEVCAWLAKPTLDNANTPRASKRAKARWKWLLDIIRQRNRRARSSWSDLSANIRRLVAAKRAATEGGTTVAFGFVAEPDVILQRCEEVMAKHNKKVAAQRAHVVLDPTPAIENVDAVIDSMNDARNNRELMLRQLCTPCYGSSRACGLARKLRAWRRGPQSRSPSPTARDRRSRSPDEPAPQVATTAAAAPPEVTFHAFVSGPGDSGMMQSDLSISSTTVDNPPTRDETAPVTPQAAAGVPAADAEPAAAAVDASLLARWTRSSTDPDSRRPVSAQSKIRRPESAAARRRTSDRPLPTPSPSLGPETGPTAARHTDLLRMLRRSTVTRPARGGSRSPSRPASAGPSLAHVVPKPGDFIAQPKPSPLASDAFPKRPHLRQRSPEGREASRSRPSSAMSRRSAGQRW